MLCVCGAGGWRGGGAVTIQCALLLACVHICAARRLRVSALICCHGTCSAVQPSHGSMRASALTCWNMPSGVRTACTSWPLPPHCVQVVGVVPVLTPLPSHVCTPGRAGQRSATKLRDAPTRSSCASQPPAQKPGWGGGRVHKERCEHALGPASHTH